MSAEVEEESGVRVGSYAGVTNGVNGYAIISSAQPYRSNWVSLGTSDLGEDIKLERPVGE
ncbi:fimbria/pilus outer membrane usher protein [Pseudomonas yamanorum]|uniref:fimbria/pilus outer membrane usher protein n=1 Tax=Pseudomonas yamanorum TaxID=515393 RepID=UPI0012FE76B8|nr:fimbria/pilus outer membrane usher protein [Pseudomonas yamanorum]